MTDAQLRTLLVSLRALALLPYPVADDDRGKLEVYFALGQIAGICDRALAPREDAARERVP